MTAAPKQTLLEATVRALARCDGFLCGELNYIQIEAYTLKAKAAIEACYAEELADALRSLLEDTQHRDHGCGDTPENCPVLKARALLAKLEGKP